VIGVNQHNGLLEPGQTRQETRHLHRSPHRLQQAAFFSIPGREKFYPGKLNSENILPGKNSVPSLKMGIKILSPWGLEGLKGNSAQSAEEVFGSYFLVEN
jgi:hypothetical protein